MTFYIHKYFFTCFIIGLCNIFNIIMFLRFVCMNNINTYIILFLFFWSITDSISYYYIFFSLILCVKSQDSLLKSYLYLAEKSYIFAVYVFI